MANSKLNGNGRANGLEAKQDAVMAHVHSKTAIKSTVSIAVKRRKKPEEKNGGFSTLASMMRFISGLSATEYSGLTNDLLSPYDLLYTYAFRYDRLIEWDLPHNRDANHKFQGGAITFTSENHWLAIVVTVAFSAVAAWNMRRAYKKLNAAKNEREKNSYQSICNKIADIKNPDKDRFQEIDAHDINYYIDKVRTGNELLNSKYSRIKLNRDTENLDIEFTDEHLQKVAKARQNQKTGFYNKYMKPVVNKLLNPTWEFLGISSFFYWIFWIGAGIFSATFGSGAPGIPSAALFAASFGMGAIFPLIKIKNWFKNRKDRNHAQVAGEDAELRQSAMNDMDKVLRLARIHREQDINKDVLQTKIDEMRAHLANKMSAAELDTFILSIKQKHSAPPACSITDGTTMDREIRSLGKDKYKKAAIAGFSTLIGAYVCSQYASWIVVDFLQVVCNVAAMTPMVNLIMGIALMAIAVAYGAYKAIDKFYSVKNQEKTLNEQLPSKANDNFDRLNAYYNQHMIDMERLKAEAAKLSKEYVALCKQAHELADNKISNYEHLKISSYDRDSKNDANYFMVDRPANKTDWSTRGRQLYEVINGFCTAAFVARIFFVANTAIFLPFAAALLSNPYTIGIVVLAGIGFGLFKLYQYNERRKEERAQKIADQRVERFEFLKERTKNAPQERMLIEMQIKDMKTAIADLNAKVVREPQAPVQALEPVRNSCFNLLSSNKAASKLNAITPISPPVNGIAIKAAS